MSALTAGRVTKEWAPLTQLRTYQMAASSQIWEGGMVALNSSGLAIAATSAASQVTVGVAQSSVLSPSTGTTYINVHQGSFNFNADTSFALTNIGSNCYALDDQTVTMTSTGHSVAGVVVQVDGATVWVKIAL